MTTVQETPSLAAEQATTLTVRQWIDGAETEGATGRTQPIYNPSTGEVSAQLVLGDATTVDEAVRAAKLTQKTWGRTSLALIAALKKEAEKIKVGPGRAKDTDMGPVITPAARQRARSSRPAPGSAH